MSAAAVPTAAHPLDLTSRTCVVTGATGDVGQAVARRLRACGASLVLHYLRNADAARALAAELCRKESGRIEVQQANLARDDEIEALVSNVIARFGVIDVVVHCASMGTFAPLMQTKPSHWQLTLDVHARAFWQLAARAPRFVRSGGSLIALSSLGGRIVTPHYGAVGVAKAALEAVVRYAAAELAPHGIRVNAIAGGPVNGARLRGSPAHPALVMAAEQRPGGRFGEPGELADVALFLASPLARWIQGQVIVVDGGFSLW